MSEYPSIVTKYTQFCLICGAPAEHRHHCLSGKDRAFAERNSIVVPLCAMCHDLYVGSKPVGHSCDVHHCPKLERLMKIIGQQAYEKQFLINKYGLPFSPDEDEAREDFRKKTGQSFL